MKIKGLIAGLALATMSVMSVGAAQADEYPSRSITMICAWGAGGGSDAVARMIAGIMEKDLGQPIKVVNQTHSPAFQEQNPTAIRLARSPQSLP